MTLKIHKMTLKIQKMTFQSCHDINSFAVSGKGEDIQSNDKYVVMMEPDVDKVSWKDTVDAMQTICKYVEQETLGDETEAKLDKLIFDIQKKKVGKRIKQSTCQDSIMKYFTKE